LERFVPIGIGNQYLKDKRPILMLLRVDTHGIPHLFRPVLENSLPHVNDKRVRTNTKPPRSLCIAADLEFSSVWYCEGIVVRCHFPISAPSRSSYELSVYEVSVDAFEDYSQTNLDWLVGQRITLPLATLNFASNTSLRSSTIIPAASAQNAGSQLETSRNPAHCHKNFLSNRIPIKDRSLAVFM